MDKKAEAVCNKNENWRQFPMAEEKEMEDFVAPWNFDSEGLGFLL